MTEQEKRTEALWTYAISHEKVLHRLVRKGYLSQEDADSFSDKLYEELNLDDVPGGRISPLGEKMRNTSVSYDAYVSLTELAREKGTAPPSYLIQSWMRSSNTTDYLRHWEKEHNPEFRDVACDELLERVHTTSVTLTPTLWITATAARGIKTTRGKGGGTMAHPEIAEMFRAWLFPAFMYELVKWYRMFQHGESNNYDCY